MVAVKSFIGREKVERAFVTTMIFVLLFLLSLYSTNIFSTGLANTELPRAKFPLGSECGEEVTKAGILTEKKVEPTDFTIYFQLSGKSTLKVSGVYSGRRLFTSYLPLQKPTSWSYLMLRDLQGDEYVLDINGSFSRVGKPAHKNGAAIESYIVEFKEEPILLKRLELEKKLKVKEKEKEWIRLKEVLQSRLETGVGTVEVARKLRKLENEVASLKARVEAELKLYEKKLECTHARARGDIGKILKNGSIGREFVRVFNGVSITATEGEVKKVEALPYVKKVWEDREVKAMLQDSVPLITASEAWKNGITGKGVTIAIVDTGVDYTHPDLGGCLGEGCKVIGGYDFVNEDNDPMDDNGHGTHVAAIAAGNGTLKGVAPDAKILAYKVLNAAGSGMESWVIAGIEKAVEDGADVISLSLGISYWYVKDCYDFVISQVVDNVVESGKVVVVAAGNEGQDGYGTIGAPGCAKNVITVGASYKKDYEAFWWDCEPGSYTPCGRCGDDGKVYCDFWGDGNPRVDELANFSSKGPAIGTVSNDIYVMVKPEVVAPGAIICAARYDSIFPSGEHPYYYPCLDDKHVQFAGTSMATPHVSGMAALLLQAHPDWGPEEIKSALVTTAKDLGYSAFSQGGGRVNVTTALEPEIIVYPSAIFFTVGNSSAVFRVKNVISQPLNLTLEVGNATSLLGKNYDVMKINATFLRLNPGESATLNLSIENPRALLQDPYGFFSGYVSVKTRDRTYRVPFSFTILSKLTVKVYDASNQPSYFDIIMVFNESGYRLPDISWGGFGNATGLATPGNLTIVTVFNGWNVPANKLTSPFILLKKAEVPPLSSKTVVLNASNSSLITLQGESSKGESFHLFRFDLTVGNKVCWFCSFTVSFADFPWVGNQSVYVSNFTDNPVDYNVTLSYLGVKEAGYCNQTSVVCEWPGYYENINLAEKHYGIGWVLDNVTGSLELTFDEPSLLTYNLSFNYPNFLPLISSHPFLYFTFFTSPLTPIKFSVGYDVVIPTNRSFVVNDPQFFYLLETFDQSEAFTFIREILEMPQSPQRFYFGTYPYQPSYFNNSNETIQLKGRLLLRGYGLNTFFYSFPLSPTLKIYNGSKLVYNESEPELWDEFSYNTTNGTFFVNVTIPTGYPVENFVLITANFTLPAKDVNPPRLNKIDFKPYFLYNVSFVVKANLSDDFGMREVRMYFRNGSEQWIERPVREVNGIYEANVTVTNSSVDRIDLKLVASDVNGNEVNYTFLPAAILARNVSLRFFVSDKFLVGSKPILKGEILEDGEALNGIRVEGYANESFIGEDASEEGRYEIVGEDSLPCSEGTVNFSVRFDGTNFYLNSENKTSVQLVSLSLSLNQTVPVHSEAIANASGAGGLLVINRSGWRVEILMDYSTLTFSPHHYGNYTVTLKTACGNLSRVLFANVTQPPSIHSITMSPSYPMAIEDATTIKLSTNSETSLHTIGNISNSTWYSVSEFSWEGITLYDPLTGEPYNVSFCLDCWELTLSNLSAGKYILNVTVEDEAQQRVSETTEIFVYPPVNVMFNVTDYLGNPANLTTVGIYFDGEEYGYYTIDGTKTLTLPNVSYFAPEHNVSVEIGIGRLLEYSQYASIHFENASLREAMNAISEYYEGKTFTKDKILHSIYVLKPSWNYENAYLVAQYNLTRLGILEHSREIEREGFESGMPEGWLTGGSDGKGWEITSKEKKSGSYSVKAGNITDDQTSWLARVIETDEPLMVSFWYKVSSEEYFDEFVFYVEDLDAEPGEIAKWTWRDSGLTEWKRIVLKLAPGKYVLNWTYSKDSSVSLYDDTVYLDEFSISTWPIEVLKCEKWNFSSKGCEDAWKLANLSEEKAEGLLYGELLSIETRGGTEAFALGVEQYCGDGYCNPEINETYETCPADCPPPETPPSPTQNQTSFQEVTPPPPTFVYDFSVKLPSKIEMLTNESKSFDILVENTGNGTLTDLQVKTKSEPYCCKLEIEPDKVDSLEPNASTNFSVRVPSGVKPGVYNLSFNVTSSRLWKEAFVSLEVKELPPKVNVTALLSRLSGLFTLITQKKEEGYQVDEALSTWKMAKSACDAKDYENCSSLLEKAEALLKEALSKGIPQPPKEGFPMLWIVVAIVVIVGVVGGGLLAVHRATPSPERKALEELMETLNSLEVELRKVGERGIDVSDALKELGLAREAAQRGLNDLAKAHLERVEMFIREKLSGQVT